MAKGLILIDIQNDYFPGGAMELVGMEEAGGNSADLLASFRDQGKPIFHIQHVASGPGLNFFLPDTEGVKIHETVTPGDGESVIEKHFPNSFRESALLGELKKADVDRIVVCGAMSHMCVEATTRAAADMGIACEVIHDACATRSQEFGGRSVSAEDVHSSSMASLAWYAGLSSTKDFMTSS